MFIKSLNLNNNILRNVVKMTAYNMLPRPPGYPD